nr:MAG TPA: hypothetical protein [Caudoviricetes sp.]
MRCSGWNSKQQNNDVTEALGGIPGLFYCKKK